MGIRLGSNTPFGAGYNQVVPQGGRVFNSPNSAQGGAGRMIQAAGQIKPDTIAENFSGPVTRHPQYPNFQAAGQIRPMQTMQPQWNPQQTSGLMNAKVLKPGLGGQPQMYQGPQSAWNPLVMQRQQPQMYAGPQATPQMMTSYTNPPPGGYDWSQGITNTPYSGPPIHGNPGAEWQSPPGGAYQRGGYRDLDGYGGQSRQLMGWWPGGYLPQGGWGGY